MKAFLTEILAVDPLKPCSMPVRWGGPTIFAKDWEEAEAHCRENMGYLRVIGCREIDEESYPLPEALQDPLAILKRGIINPN